MFRAFFDNSDNAMVIWYGGGGQFYARYDANIKWVDWTNIIPEIPNSGVELSMLSIAISDNQGRQIIVDTDRSNAKLLVNRYQ